MAVKVPTVKNGHPYDGSIHNVEWLALANTDTGTPVQVGAHDVHDVQVDGTFGAGGSISIEGSSDGTNWYVLSKSPGGAAATFTAGGVDAIVESPIWIRPHVTAGDGTTALNCRMTLHRPTPMRT